jgi:phage tail sheath gpL-like
MVALTWWGWSGLVVSVGVILWIWARHAWRAAVRQELVDYLAHAAPDLAVTDVHLASIVCCARDGGAAGAAVTLRAFYRDLAAHPGGSAESEAARLAIFAAVADAARAKVGDHRVHPLRRAS